MYGGVVMADADKILEARDVSEMTAEVRGDKEKWTFPIDKTGWTLPIPSH